MKLRVLTGTLLMLPVVALWSLWYGLPGVPKPDGPSVRVSPVGATERPRDTSVRPAAGLGRRNVDAPRPAAMTESGEEEDAGKDAGGGPKGIVVSPY